MSCPVPNYQSGPVDVLLVVASLGTNSLVRAFALSQILDCAELDWRVVSLSSDEIWPPLARSIFSEKCFTVDELELRQQFELCEKVIALKPLPESLGVCLALTSNPTDRVILDMDDPDLELRLERPLLPRLLSRILRPGRYRTLEQLRQVVPQLQLSVSNEGLKKRWGGVVVPHVRFRNHQTDASRPGRFVCFIGTSRRHKGVSKLRRAVELLNRRGVQIDLLISDRAPLFPRPWEQWLGPVSFEEARQLERGAAVSVCTIWKEPYRSRQLPAKAIDAIVANIPLITNRGTTVEALVGPHGIYVSDNRARSLALAISSALTRRSGTCYPEEIKNQVDPLRYAPVFRSLIAPCD